MSTAPTPGSPVALLLCDDLLFASRVTGTAQDLGWAVKAVRRREDLLPEVHREKSPCVILDLSFPDLRLEELVKELSQATTPPPRLAAFGPHVDVEALERARQAGCNPVLPRSALLRDLSRCLPAWLAQESPAEAIKDGM